MAQNLDLDLSTSRALTSADSDVANWTPTNNTQTSKPSGFNENNNVVSWDPGYKYCVPNKCDLTSTTNFGHDSQGNYCSWGAATAGQASSLTQSNTGQEATQSVCPKGWRLPKGTNTANTSGNFRTLTNALGATSGTSDGSFDANLISSPAYFVRTGLVYSGSLSSLGAGLYWSSTASGANKACSLYFSASSVNPSFTNSNNTLTSYYHARHSGLTVRCVAR